MDNTKPSYLDKETTDGAKLNLDVLYQLFPSCFTEAKDVVTGEMRRVVDWSKLRALLGEYVEDGEPEKYDFTWVGKRAAQREAAKPCRMTLRPCPEESVDWDTTQNLYIEGDNLEVLKLLQNSYMGKVKMIYIDPPYNTGNDFVYHDDFAQSADEYDEHNRDDEGNRFRKNTDSNGRFHSDWCSMIYTRLMVARSLLTEDGVIFISIDDNEVENLRKICDELFGLSNFISQITLVNNIAGRSDSTHVAIAHEYILMYCKTDKFVSKGLPLTQELLAEYRYEDKNGKYRIQGLRKRGTNSRREDRPNLYYPFYYDAVNNTLSTNKFENSIEIYPHLSDGADGNWRWGKESAQLKIDFLEVRMVSTRNEYDVFEKVYLNSTEGERTTKLKSFLLDSKYTTDTATTEYRSIMPAKSFTSPKSIALIETLCRVGNTNDDMIILDFFSGSATTAHAVMQLNTEDGGNRKFIMVQLPEETAEDSEAYKAGYKYICEIGKERIRRAGKKIKSENPLTTKDLDIGFRVLKCDESNFKPVAFGPSAYSQTSLDDLLDNIKEDRTGLDLLFDCMMRWGLELSLPYTTQQADDCTIYNVDDGNLVACFDGQVTESTIDTIAQMHPLRVVFRDSSFTEAAEKMNLFELFKQKCGWTDQEVRNNVRVI